MSNEVTSKKFVFFFSMSVTISRKGNRYGGTRTQFFCEFESEHMLKVLKYAVTNSRPACNSFVPFNSMDLLHLFDPYKPCIYNPITNIITTRSILTFPAVSPCLI